MQSFFQEHLTKQATGGAHGSHYVYWIPIHVFNALPITLWKYNRPPDPERVAEIRAYTKTAKRVDGLIYLACINNELVCYEANHRREALKEDMPADLAPVLVDVLWNATDEMVKEEFLRLNKAISVPELYIREPAVLIDASKLREAVTGFCESYKVLKSSANHPQRPNFTRDMLMDEFYRVMTELHIDVEELMVRLQRLNTEMRSRDRRKLSPKVVAKCEAAGLWLFAWSNKLNAKELD